MGVVKKISVKIVTEGVGCSADCPYFSLEPGASYENPFIERCLVFKVDLVVGKAGTVSRCPECMEHDLGFHQDAVKMAMEDACMGKEAALKLLKDTKYTIDIYEYATAKDLFDILIEDKKLPREYIKKLLEISDDHLDLLIRGVEHPYLLTPLKEKLGFPKAPPMTSDDLRHHRAFLIRRSERLA